MRSLRTETSDVSPDWRNLGGSRRPAPGPIWPRAVAFVAGATAVMAVSASLSQSDVRPGRREEPVAVAAQLTSNDCGAGLGVPDLWQNAGRVSKSGDVVQWEPADGSVPLSGTLDNRSSATMRSTLIVQMKPPDVATTGCVMRRDDRLNLVLAPNSASTPLAGNLTYTFSSLTGPTCSGELAASGGTYNRLPLRDSLRSQREIGCRFRPVAPRWRASSRFVRYGSWWAFALLGSHVCAVGPSFGVVRSTTPRSSKRTVPRQSRARAVSPAQRPRPPA